MGKQKLTERLVLLNSGRALYLDFLRNLTPQTVLFSIVLLLGARLDFTRFGFDNCVLTFLFFVLLGAFALAFYANSTLFYEKCFGDWKEWLKNNQKSLTTQGVKGPQRLVAVFRAIWRERLIEFIEVTTALYFLQIAFAIVIAMAMQSASIMLRANHVG